MANRGCYNSDLRKGLAIIIFVVSLLFFNHCNANDLNYAHESSLFKIKYSDYKAWLSKDGLDTIE